MSDFARASQQAVFETLTAALSVPVTDTPQDLPSGMPDSAFPYVNIADAAYIQWGAQDTIGMQVDQTVHFWSKSPSNRENLGLMQQAFAALNRANLTYPGIDIVDCLFLSGFVVPDPDQKTKHAVQRYRLTMGVL